MSAMNGHKQTLFRIIQVPDLIIPRAAAELAAERHENMKRYTDVMSRKKAYAQREEAMRKRNSKKGTTEKKTVH